MLADSLAIAAAQIPDAVDAKTLPEGVRSGFLSEARTLRNQAQQLKKDAQGKRAESMQRTLDSINATCLNCHSKYRDLTGNLDFPLVRANWRDERVAGR
jgi:cytochrome c556